MVAFGASSYGMLASIVKLAYREGFTTAEVTLSQVLLGLIGIFIINLLRKNKPDELSPTAKDIRNLMLGGTSIGFTSVLYYVAVSYIDASIAVVLLMQSVWIGVVLESLIARTFPSLLKIVSVVLVLIGTILATNLLTGKVAVDYRGVVFGFLAACSFTATMYSTGQIANHLAAPKRSLFMLCGAIIVVVLFAFFTQVGPNNFEGIKRFYFTLSDNSAGIRDFDWRIFYSWGILLSLFGTILPPLFLNMGFPITGVGLGSIISSLELPVSVTFAFLLLGESVIWLQWTGILIILFAIVLMNSNLIFGSRESTY